MTRKRNNVHYKQRPGNSQKSDDDTVYCICRSPDGTRFMIACDNCEEWFHGDCIDVSPRHADNIKRYFCQLCIGKNSNLEIQYKTMKGDRPRLNLRQRNRKANYSSSEESNADLSSSISPGKLKTYEKDRYKMRKQRYDLPESTVKMNRIHSAISSVKYDEEATEDEIETIGLIQDELDEDIENKPPKRKYRKIKPKNGFLILRSQMMTKAGKRAYMNNEFSFEANDNMCVSELCHICSRYSPTTSYLRKCPENRCIGPPLGVKQEKKYIWGRVYCPDEEPDQEDSDYLADFDDRIHELSPRYNMGRIRHQLATGGNSATSGARVARCGGQTNNGPVSALFQSKNNERVLEPDIKPFASNYQQHLRSIIKHEPKTDEFYRYGLEYPDHHYCKNHRAFEGRSGLRLSEVKTEKTSVVKSEPVVKTEKVDLITDILSSPPMTASYNRRRSRTTIGSAVSPLRTRNNNKPQNDGVDKQMFYSIDDEDNLDINWP